MNNAYNQQIFHFREEKGLSLKEAAKAIGISSLSLFMYEHGYFKPTKKDLAKIEAFYKPLDFEDNNEYPAPLETKNTKELRPMKKRLIIFGAISTISLALSIIGGTLFTNSAKNQTSSYGEEYTEVREKTIQGEKTGRDLLTDLKFYYADFNEGFYGIATVRFYETNSLLYFNQCYFTSNSATLEEGLGVGRFHYQFGGSLADHSNILTFTYSNSDHGTFFTCKGFYNDGPVENIYDINISSPGDYPITDELVNYLFNFKLPDLRTAFKILFNNTTGREITIDEFLNAREEGREKNLGMQVAGLIMLFPGMIAFFVMITLLLQTLIHHTKALLHPLEEEPEKEENTRLPKDLRLNFGIPDYIILWITRGIWVTSIFLILFSSIGGLALPLPAFFKSGTFLSILQMCFVAVPFVNQIILFNSMKRSKTLFVGLTKYLLLYIAIATFETILVSITSAWGYEIGDLIYKYIPVNTFLACALNYLLFMFLFFKPRFLKNKGLVIMWRLFALIPIGGLVALTIIGNSFELFYEVQKNIYLIFWFSNSNLVLTIIVTLYCVALFIIKTIFKAKYGRKSASLFYNGNRYMLIVNLVCTAIIVFIVAIDLLFVGNEYGYYLGLGENLWVLAIIPFILLCRVGPNSIELSHVDDETIGSALV